MSLRTSLLLPAALAINSFRHIPRPLLWLVAACAAIPMLGSRMEVDAASPPFKYVVRRFGFLPVEPQINVRAIAASGSKTLGMNNHGDIVGVCEYTALNDDPSSEYYNHEVSWLYAFHYTRDHHLLNLSKLWDEAGLQDQWPGLGMGWAADINDVGQIIGETAGGSSDICCVRYTPPAIASGGPIFADWGNSVGPFHMNNHGDLLGRDVDGTFLYIEGTGRVPIPRFDGYYVLPRAVNDNREILGLVNSTGALRYSLVNGFSTLSKPSRAADINNSGDVVGYAIFKGQDEHAMWWYFENGVERVKDLGTLGGKWSSAYSISNATDRSKVMILGSSSPKKGLPRPFVYTSATGMVDLLSCIVGEVVIDPDTGSEVIVPSDPNWSFSPVTINAAGQIAGDLAGGIPWQAVLLDPVK